MNRLLIMTFAVSSSYAFAQKPQSSPKKEEYNPSAYIQKEESQKAHAPVIKESVITIGGVKYRALRTSFGTLYLPKLTDFTQEDLEKALCGAGNATSQEHEKAALIRAEVPVSSNVKIYGEMIQQTAKKRCHDNETEKQTRVNFAPNPEIGVEFVLSKKRGATKYKVYKNNLKPEIGVGAEF
jgi:hypothetical protein